MAGEVDRETVESMSAMLAHRGPDGEGMFVDEQAGIALAHRRLAILDLSAAGRQPMTSRDGRWTITYNGEVFNYLELREELGGPWKSASDTEVLLQACARWGVEGAIQRLVGMFAFALWDAAERTLYLARDRVGEKPLVYFRDARRLAFASEIKALASLAGGRLDRPAVELYLALGYVPAPHAIYRGCSKLPAGHYLTWRKGQVQVRRYWYPEKAHCLKPTLLSDAVRMRLRSDVPVALYLSGGVDSSVVAAECAGLNAKLEAYTAAFDEDRTDLPYAEEVARHLGLPHHVIEIKAEPLEAMLRHYDEPFADSSLVPCFALARALRGHFKVVLDGDGGDEAYGGYRHYQHIGAKQRCKAVAVAVGARDGRASDPAQVYVQSKALWRRHERERLLGAHGDGDSVTRFVANGPFLNQAPRCSALKRAMWIDRHLYLSNNLTYKMDIALMASGIEGRAPLLDHRVLEGAQQLADARLVRGRDKKIALRQAYRGVLPERVLDRRKHGFGAPISKWLENGLGEIARDVLPSPLLESGAQRDHTGERLWSLLLFGLWARIWRASW